MESRILLPGHCIELRTDGAPQFGQVLAVGVTNHKRPNAPYMAILLFKGCIPEFHSDLPFRQLTRGSLRLTSSSRVLRWAQIVPFFRATLENEPCVRYATKFLVNSSVYKKAVGPQDREVFLFVRVRAVLFQYSNLKRKAAW